MIKIGILGCANIATRSVLPTLAKHPSFTITAIASRNIEKAKAIACQYSCAALSYDELINSCEIEAIYIPLPTGLHYQWCLAALNNGKHIICEKSLATNLTQAKTLIDKAKTNNCALMETFQFRFHRQNIWAKNYVSEGHLGKIRCFRSSFGFPPFADPENIRYKAHLGGGALLDAGAYTLQALSFVFPHEFEVMSSLLRYSPNSEVDLGGGIMLADSHGCTAELAFGFDNFYQCNYEIWGTKAKLTVNRAFTAPANFIPDILVERQGEQEKIHLENDDHFFNLFSEFAKNIKLKNFEMEYQVCLKQATLLEKVMQTAKKIYAE